MPNIHEEFRTLTLDKGSGIVNHALIMHFSDSHVVLSASIPFLRAQGIDPYAIGNENIFDAGMQVMVQGHLGNSDECLATKNALKALKLVA